MFRHSRVEVWAAPLAGLVATGWVAWSAAIVPPMRNRFGFRIAFALGIAVAALVWSAVIALTLRFLSRNLRRAEARPATPQTWALAVWFAPATILLLGFSPISVAAGLALVIGATRLVLAGALPVEVLPRHFLPALVIATIFQAGAVSVIMSYRLPGAGLLAMSTAMLAAAAIVLGTWVERDTPNLWRSVASLAVIVLLAIMAGRFTPGGFPGGSDASAQAVSKTGGSAGAPQPQIPPEKTPGMSVPGGYPGVILWPEIRRVPLLIAPVLAGGSAMTAQSRPLTIPFGGVYWMFRAPFPSPPRNSYFQRGTPATLSFRTTDKTGLRMEARQHLGRAVSTSCCSRLDVEVLNSDPYPHTVSLELVLIDGQQPSAAPQSLGAALVTSAPVVTPDFTAPIPETLRFSFPRAPRLEQFDEIKVVFQMAIGRRDRSARIAIERFVLVPR